MSKASAVRPRQGVLQPGGLLKANDWSENPVHIHSHKYIHDKT